MTRLLSCITITILLAGCGSSRQDKSIEDPLFYNGLNKWFTAWELVSKDIYSLDSLSPVELVFFDEQYVYSTSNITIPEGELVKGPDLLDHPFIWKRALHKDSITLPDKSRVPVGLMSFAAPLPGDNAIPFFVMPLPEFWKKAGVSSKELGDENLYTGVFLHEFSHSQQMRNFGKKISELENANNFGIEFSDDIVQEIFEKDSSYVSMYTSEVNSLYEAVSAKDSSAKSALIKKGIDNLRSRHQKFFVEKYAGLKNIDEFFLTMEGLGQYTMYAWLTHKDGANLPAETAIIGVRRGKKSWSQDEGFAWFLLLEQVSERGNWARGMFGDGTESVVKLLEQLLRH